MQDLRKEKRKISDIASENRKKKIAEARNNKDIELRNNDEKIDKISSD